MTSEKELVERLRRIDKPAIRVFRPDGLTTSNATYFNPDGPRAADLIEAQRAEIAIYRDKAETFGRACEEKDAEIARKDATLEKIASLTDEQIEVEGWSPQNIASNARAALIQSDTVGDK